LSAGDILICYALGVAAVALLTDASMRREPTTHGQDVLYGMGCIIAPLWPLVLAYLLLFGLPMLAITKLRERR
jgi:hypothetical protein